VDKRNLQVIFMNGKKLQIHRGIYFHSQFDFYNLSSLDVNLSDLGLMEYLNGLMEPQGKEIEVGSKYFFVYPIRVKNKNWVLIGFGETVYTLQEERKGRVKVPFIQYFLIKLSDFITLQLHPSLFERFLIEYGDIFNETLKNRDFKLNYLYVNNGSECFEGGKDLVIPKMRSQIKLYTESFDKALKIYYHLIQRIPRIVSWLYRVIIAPLEAADYLYQADIAIIYSSSVKNEYDIGAIDENDIGLRQILNVIKINDENLLEKFERFIKEKSFKDLIAFFDYNELDLIVNTINKFIDSYERWKNKEIMLSKGDQLITYTHNLLNEYVNSGIDDEIKIENLIKNLTEIYKFKQETEIFNQYVPLDLQSIEQKLKEIVQKSPLPILYSTLHKILLSLEEHKNNVLLIKMYGIIEKEISDMNNLITHTLRNLESQINEAQDVTSAFKIIKDFITQLSFFLTRLGKKSLLKDYTGIFPLTKLLEEINGCYKIFAECCKILKEKIERREIDIKYEEKFLANIIESIAEKIKDLNQQDTWASFGKGKKLQDNLEDVLKALKKAEIIEVERRFRELSQYFTKK